MCRVLVLGGRVSVPCVGAGWVPACASVPCVGARWVPARASVQCVGNAQQFVA